MIKLIFSFDKRMIKNKISLARIFTHDRDSINLDIGIKISGTRLGWKKR